MNSPYLHTLLKKYQLTAMWYDMLDFPWELQYKKWRHLILVDVHGSVLEAGVGTGRNLKYYAADVDLTGIELSPAMLKRAKKRAQYACCQTKLLIEDATTMTTIPANNYDWVISTFMCCVLPDNLQQEAAKQFCRVLKPGGKFRLLDIVYSHDPLIFKRQQLFSGLIKKLYGARLDTHVIENIASVAGLKITKAQFLKEDTYLFIEGEKVA